MLALRNLQLEEKDKRIDELTKKIKGIDMTIVVLASLIL